MASATRDADAASMETASGHDANGSARPRVGYAAGVAGFPEARSGRAAGAGQWPPQLRTFRFDGAAAGGPRGEFWYAHPRAAMDADGSLHVVWAEPDEKLPAGPTALRGDIPPLRSLWHAMLRGGMWSRPQRIYRAMHLGWGEDNNSRLIADGRGGLHIAFVASDSAGPGIVFLRSDSGSSRAWRATVAIRPPGVYLDLAVDRAGQPAIAFIQAGGYSQPRTNVLFLIRSPDGGESWPKPTEISTPGEDPAFEPHVFFDRDGALRLVWVQQPTGDFTGGKVWHTTLDGAGRRSTSSLDLPSTVITSHSQATIDACGTVHFMTQWYPNGVAELRYARVTADGWSAWSRPFDVPGAHASLAADEGAVHVVWTSSSRSPADSTLRSALAHAALPFARP